MHILKEPITVEGIGVHTGKQTRLTLRPWSGKRLRDAVEHGEPLWDVEIAGTGTRFPVRPDLAVEQDYMSILCWHQTRVRTPEHLLATLFAMEIGGVTLVLAGEEVPILDGSATPWVRLLRMAIRPIPLAWPTQTLNEAFAIRESGRALHVEPAAELVLDYTLTYKHPLIGTQSFHFRYATASFIQEIAPARTFGFLEEADSLRARGLALGADTENTLVFTPDGILNPPLRFPDEPVRHKILDLLGDLALLGGVRPCAHIQVIRGGHRLHLRMVRELVRRWSKNLQPDGKP